MRVAAFLLAASFLLMAGCSAKGAQDPFAYTRKDLAHTSFDLALTQNKTDEQQFRVEDGSIATIQLRVWVNATAGHATVDIYGPSGKKALSTSETTSATVPIDLGVWRIVVTGTSDAAGDASIVATRAGTTRGAS